jgi:DNA invertase Pin-like site-specific DNA recombinase
MKRAALYMRVSTLDQHPETQLYDLRQMAQQRGYQIVEEYTDTISGAKARRPGLDAMMRDARRGRFDVVLVWASDRIARSVKHFLDVLDELNPGSTRLIREIDGRQEWFEKTVERFFSGKRIGKDGFAIWTKFLPRMIQ